MTWWLLDDGVNKAGGNELDVEEVVVVHEKIMMQFDEQGRCHHRQQSGGRRISRQDKPAGGGVSDHGTIKGRGCMG